MINPWCPPDLESKKKYVAKSKYINQLILNNSILDLEEEKRLSWYHTDIIKTKLYQLKYKPDKKIKILDICGGSGFVTYHIYKIFGKENKYCLIDINKNEVNKAKVLLGNKAEFITDDFLLHAFKTKYDLIIGSSFLHHFPNVPKAINKIYGLLKSNGYFIDLHEPGEKAAFIESIGRDSLPETARLLKINNNRKGTVGTDLWMFKRNDLKNLLEKSGFEKIIIYKTGFLRTIFETLKTKIPLSTAYKIDSLILNNFKFPFFNSYFFIAWKK